MLVNLWTGFCTCVFVGCPAVTDEAEDDGVCLSPSWSLARTHTHTHTHTATYAVHSSWSRQVHSDTHLWTPAQTAHNLLCRRINMAAGDFKRKLNVVCSSLTHTHTRSQQINSRKQIPLFHLSPNASDNNIYHITAWAYTPSRIRSFCVRTRDNVEFIHEERFAEHHRALGGDAKDTMNVINKQGKRGKTTTHKRKVWSQSLPACAVMWAAAYIRAGPRRSLQHCARPAVNPS